ncbi:hypothetical protein MANES_02G072200v8 [Manihot esculenta]|uniref:Uncharacterized protein n=1 Tax=Manihot esculenta TaxID=3983 RepID=A0A2C9WBR2_MANES|nr:hypothetical protein MANES_02G072200v8 [Manihot esculenta]
MLQAERQAYLRNSTLHQIIDLADQGTGNAKVSGFTAWLPLFSIYLLLLLCTIAVISSLYFLYVINKFY